MVSAKQSVIRVGNILTASFCNDRWREEVPNEPKLRPICRLILTLITICLILVAAVLLFKLRTDSFRSVRYLGDELLPTIYDRRLNASLSSSDKLLCPCTNQNSIAWNSSLMKIFLLSRNSDQFSEYLINDSEDFCRKEWRTNIAGSSYLYWGCPTMVNSLLFTGTQILTSTLLDHDSLVNTLVKSIEQSVGSVLNSYRLLLNFNNTEWLMIEELGAAFMGVTGVFGQNSSSSEEDYWNAFGSNKAPDGKLLQDVLVGRALALELNWTVYLKQCDPVYCDEVIANSLLSRFLSAIALLGGLISVLLFLIRSVLWPGLRLVAGWSSEHNYLTRGGWQRGDIQLKSWAPSPKSQSTGSNAKISFSKKVNILQQT